MQIARAASSLRAPQFESMTIDRVARQVMYRANSVPDTVVDAADTAGGGSKLATALLQLTRSTSLNFEGVRSFVGVFAGADGHIGPDEFERMSIAIHELTSQMKWGNRIPDLRKVTFEQQARMYVQDADVDFDGRIGPGDVAAQSDMAQVVLEVLGTTSTTHDTLMSAIIAAFPASTPEASMLAFSTNVYEGLKLVSGRPTGVMAWSRAELHVFDSNQDLRLTADDGITARGVLGVAGRTTMQLGDVMAKSARFDTVGADGLPGSDGRLDRDELGALTRAQYAASHPPQVHGEFVH